MPTDPSPELRVAVDAGPMIAERSGVGHTTAALLGGLAGRSDLDTCGYAVSRNGRAALRGMLPPGVRPGTSWFPARAAVPIWRRASWPRLEHWTGPVDVVHATNFVAPPTRASVLLTVHDLTFAHQPELCRPETLGYEHVIRRALDRGATVHAVSDFVAAEAREFFGLPPDRVVRVYYGVSHDAATGRADQGRSRAGADRYLLAIGTIEPRKNYARLVEAFTTAAAHDRDLHLVIAGGAGWGEGALWESLERSPAASRVHLTGYVSDADRADLLAGATALVYPSLSEGFGHPPFEAMAAGVPVVASDTGAIPEAVGDAAVLVDPRDADALAQAMLRVCADGDLRDRLVAQGHARIEAFPWSRAVDEFVALYRRLKES